LDVSNEKVWDWKTVESRGEAVRWKKDFPEFAYWLKEFQGKKGRERSLRAFSFLSLELLRDEKGVSHWLSHWSPSPGIRWAQVLA